MLQLDGAADRPFTPTLTYTLNHHDQVSSRRLRRIRGGGPCHGPRLRHLPLPVECELCGRLQGGCPLRHHQGKQHCPVLLPVTPFLTPICPHQATEGTTYIDPSFSSHYTGATKAGFIRGGYHFAHPSSSTSTATAQADYFIAHGGGWSGDGITLPGMLDLESESAGECWGLSASAMVAWIKAFSDRYHSREGVYPMLYTNPSWWKDCTGNSNAFVKTNPLVLAHYSSTVGTIPGGWPYQTIWQNSDSYAYGGDSDIFNGSLDRLQALARG